MDKSKKTFAYARYQYGESGWRRLDTGKFISHAKTPRGVANVVQTIVPDVNRDRDMVFFCGKYLRNDNDFVIGIWCPLLHMAEGFEMQPGGKPPQRYDAMLAKFKSFIEKHNQ